MRLYSFVNANYLKHVQHGLQTAHALAEMYEKYGFSLESNLLHDWARNHKTIIILDGGDCFDLHDIVKFLIKNDKKLNLPFSYFKEDARSLHNALTAVTVVVPPEIYDVKKITEIGVDNKPYVKYELNDMGFWFPTTPSGYSPLEEFYNLLKSKPLAR